MGLKDIERAYRAWVLRNVSRLLRTQESVVPPDWADRPHRVLYLRADRIGDMIMATGLLRAIAGSYPTVTVDVLASPINAAVLDGHSAVGRVIVLDKRRPWRMLAALRRVRRTEYDAVIDGMVQAPSVTTLLLMLASGARHRIGVAGRRIDDALTIAVPPAPPQSHYITQSMALARAFQIDPACADHQPDIPILAADRRDAEATWKAWGACCGQRLLINVSAGHRRREWPEERVVTVLRHIATQAPSLRPMVIAGPRDVERGSRIAAKGHVPYVRTRRLHEAFALVATANAVFTPDTSIAHAASAFRIPVVAMYPRRKRVPYGPFGTRGWCVESSDSTLDSLPVSRVLTAIDEMLMAIDPAR